jgi:signal transduction histidine kinase
MTRPIYVQIRALLLGQTTLTDVWATIQEQAENNHIFILFVDNRGNLVTQASPQNSNQLFNVPGGLPHGISQPVQGIFTASGGQKFVYAAYPLGRSVSAQSGRAETMVLCEPRSSVALIMAGLINPFIWAGIIALAISLLLAFLVARSVYRPIQRLSKAAESIAQGHYDEQVPVTGPPEIKGLAGDFNQMAAAVKESQQHLRHFVADVSHQLKSPLTSIQGFAQAMLDGTADNEETRNKAMHIILDESRRMIRQVNELLELSRMQAGQVKMAKDSVDIKEILQRCEEIFALRLEEKKITLVNRFGPLPLITGDADRLEDVFCNLLDNAIKNTPHQGEIQVTVQDASINPWL